MKPDKSIIKGLALITQIGISMLTPIFLCVFIGYQLDKVLSKSYWLIIFLVLGIASAFRNVYYLTKQFYAKDMRREQDELKYLSDLKNAKLDKERKK